MTQLPTEEILYIRLSRDDDKSLSIENQKKALLKLCPKGRIVVIDAERPGQWLLVEPGSPIEEVIERLGIPQPSDPPARSPST